MIIVRVNGFQMWRSYFIIDAIAAYFVYRNRGYCTVRLFGIMIWNNEILKPKDPNLE